MSFRGLPHRIRSLSQDQSRDRNGSAIQSPKIFVRELTNSFCSQDAIDLRKEWLLVFELLASFRLPMEMPQRTKPLQLLTLPSEFPGASTSAYFLVSCYVCLDEKRESA